MRCMLLVVFLLVSLPSYAAELTFVDDGICNYLLKGRIELGDSIKLQELKVGYEPKTLCLNSEGGNLAEGLKLFAHIWHVNIHTLVLPQHSCLSACAIVFMAGSDIQGTDLTRQISRNIFPGGVIGFHGPILELPRSRVQRTEFVLKSYRGAIEAAALLFDISRISEKQGKTISDFLLGMILRTPPGKMYKIQTVGDLLLTDIWPVGIYYEYPTKNDFVINVCRNLLASRPPKNYAFSLAKNSRDHYYAVTDLEEGQIHSADRYYPAPKVEIRQGADEALLGWAGPFASGTKYGNLECLVKLSTEKSFDSYNDIREPEFGEHAIAIGVSDSAGYYNSTIVSAGLRLAFLIEEENEPRFSTQAYDLEYVPPWYLFSYDTKVIDLPLIPGWKSRFFGESVAERSSAHNNSSTNSDIFSQYSGFDIVGEDIEIFADITKKECLRRCKETNICEALTFDRWNNYCILKENPKLIQVNTKADSYIKIEKSNLVNFSDANITLTKRRNKYFPSEPVASANTRTLDDCNKMCLGWKGCTAFHIKANKCEIFEKPDVYIDGLGYTAGYFTQ